MYLLTYLSIYLFKTFWSLHMLSPKMTLQAGHIYNIWLTQNLKYKQFVRALQMVGAQEAV
jgi:hypothetical protein